MALLGFKAPPYSEGRPNSAAREESGFKAPPSTPTTPRCPTTAEAVGTSTLSIDRDQLFECALESRSALGAFDGKEAASEAMRSVVATRMQANFRGLAVRKGLAKATDGKDHVKDRRSSWVKLRATTKQSSAIDEIRRTGHSFASIRKALRSGQWRSVAARLAGAARSYLSGDGEGPRKLAALRAAVSGGPVGARGQYGRTCSRVRRRTLNPVWNDWLELRIEGGAVNEKGVYDNPAAPYTRLRIEVWDKDRLSRDDYIGEVGLPLVALMDARTHAYSMTLGDPEGRTNAEGGVKGEITFELKYEP